VVNPNNPIGAPYLPNAACAGQVPEMWQMDAICDSRSVSVSLEDKRFAAKATAAAIDICRQCPEIVDCLRHATNFEEPTGVWGGMTTREREQWLMRWGKKDSA
jgi:hypothetical protein